MGKKKGGAGGGGPKRAFKKDPVATKMATSGVKKTKTKVVSTSLKRMNFQNRAQTEAVDAQFAQLQQLKKEKPKSVGIAGAAKAEAERALQSEASKSKSTSKPELEVEPDMDMAADEFSKLASSV